MAIEWKKNDLPTLAQKVADDASETCQNFIYAGIDVELSGGTQHFSLMPNDQTNIDSMFAAITLGASEYPYHPDGGKCVMYSAADIITLYSEYKSFVTKQTTYCNALRQWAKRETDPNVIGSIYYGFSDVTLELSDELLDALAAHRTWKPLEHEQVIVCLLEAVVIVNVAGHYAPSLSSLALRSSSRKSGSGSRSS